MGNPFSKLVKNSSESAHVDKLLKGDAKVTTRKCAQCGAPRPAYTDLSHCTYCGFQFMVVPVPAPDPAPTSNENE